MKQRAYIIARFLRPTYGGIIVGTLFYCLALTPSLLPRPPLFAGIIAGLSFGIGYSLGVGISWIVRRFWRSEPSKTIKRRTWHITLGICGIVMVAYSIWNTTWENKVRRLIGEPDLLGQHVIIILGMALIAAGVMLIAGKLIGSAILCISRLTNRWVPTAIGLIIGVVVVGFVSSWIYQGVIFKTFKDTTNRTYSKIDQTTPKDVSAIKSTVRSGGPESLVSWASLGYQGRGFIGSGPSRQQITSITNKPASEPIRVYIGLNAAENAKKRADLAVRELERTGAFTRDVLVVAGSTGTGWIEPQAADSLEYIWNGNSAIVSAQYSYLPSWISFLVDQQKATDTSAALFDAVHAKWQTLPKNERPKLISFGLSLGSFGAQSAFSNVSDIQHRTDGALFMGTPNFTKLWNTVKDSREKNSPEWQPTIGTGRTVHFASDAQDIQKNTASWHHPRVLYMQHASDPVVWWSYDLMWKRPDWLREKRGPDVSQDMKWYPFVTFAQVTVDQFFGTSVPDGHGHNYGNAVVAAWTAVAAPEGWDEQQAHAIQSLIDTYQDD